MLKLKVKQDFNDWQMGGRRLVGDVFEVSQERYDELKTNLADQGIEIDAVVEIIKPSKKAAGEAPAK